MFELAVDLLWPSRGTKSVERILDKSDPDTIAVEFVPGALTRGLNESGWFADEVLAVGILRQGKAPSVLPAVTGLTLVELARRRSKSLPCAFVLAATADRVVAFAMKAHGVDTTTWAIEIMRGELGFWPRELVRLIDLGKGLFSWGATLGLAGAERFPVTWDGDDSSCSSSSAADRTRGGSTFEPAPGPTLDPGPPRVNLAPG